MTDRDVSRILGFVIRRIRTREHCDSPVQMESPVGTTVVHPRRKAGQPKLGRGTQVVLLTKSDLGLGEASKQLGLSATTVKKVCRTLGIHKWSSASSREHRDSLESASSRKSFFDNTQAFAWPAHSHNSGAASDSGLSISYTASTATAQERADNSTPTGRSSPNTVDGGRSAHPSEALDPAP